MSYACGLDFGARNHTPCIGVSFFFRSAFLYSTRLRFNLFVVPPHSHTTTETHTHHHIYVFDCLFVALRIPLNEMKCNQQKHHHHTEPPQPFVSRVHSINIYTRFTYTRTRTHTHQNIFIEKRISKKCVSITSRRH